MKFRPVATYVLILWILLLVSPVSGQDTEEAVGQIISAENTVTVTRADGQESSGQAGLPLYAGDTLITGEDSRVKFSLNDTDMFELGESSEMAVDEFSDLAKEEGNQPLLRLVTGFLRSTISSLKGDDAQPAVQTPTVVAGIRGTVFDTVVSLDGTTAFAVDEGRIEVDWEAGKEMLEAGQSAEVDEETESMNLLPAFAGKDRKWKEWRGKKEKDMQGKLRTMLPRFRKRFENAAAQYTDLENELQNAQMQVATAMEAVRKAEAGGDPHAVEQAMQQFGQQSAVLRNAVRKSRLYANQYKAMNRQWSRIGKHAKKNKDRFSPEELMEIQTQDEFVRMKGKDLKDDSRQRIKGLKHTAKEIRKFRKERGKNKGEHVKEVKRKSRKEHTKKEHGEHKKKKEHDGHKDKNGRQYEEDDD